jgi:ABC-type transport system involved in cytochrome c biogenesis permease subunit
MKDGRIPISQLIRALREAGGALGMEDVPPALREMMTNATGLAIYPHPNAKEENWLSLGHLMFGGMVVDSMQEPALKILGDWEELVPLRNDPAAFANKLGAISSDIHARAKARGKGGQLGYELAYNKADFFYYALQAFVLAFLLQAVTWLKNPTALSTRWLHAGTWMCMGAGFALVVSGMVLRTMIMERWVTSVVTNLYETILFISAIMVLVGLAAEAVTRRKLALPITAVCAAAGMFISMKYEAKEGSDTLSTLQAVLNTNYWLSIHVTTINMGYAAGMLGAGFAGVYLVARLFDPRRTDADFFRTIARCTYGIVCFGLLFSLVGTILGGLWANDSWGRFWGWDPKENGALMIVLSFLIILHARLGGYIREFGLHMLTLLSGAVVAFSWWHVNLLGVGLHSYGFTSGIKKVVFYFYGAVAVIFVLGVVAWVLGRILGPADGSPGPAASGRSPAFDEEKERELAAARQAAA